MDISMNATIQIEKRIKEENKQSKFSHVIMLSFERLHYFPEVILHTDHANRLRRLDISFNNISILPDQITLLQNLRELWCNNNPISMFPTNIESLTRLEVLDIRSTKITSIPAPLGTLTGLYDLDWQDTPAASRYHKKYGLEPNDMVKLREVLLNEHVRIEEELKLKVALSEHYIKEADMASFADRISELVEVTFKICEIYLN